ncbi:unnamed protein product [Adineta steineri]|uniref:RING-type domain-containing protein n=1 Tax=Adineta steineri TaxID=433720 RepID=A0A814QV24_9BILA|nr:unnamed protein product [Adineta steineri]CAF1124796.1 unnamed protein product [Adineta steineri]
MCSEEDLFFYEKNIDRERIIINKNSSLLNDCFCSICWCLLWKPCSCSSCQNLFCNECIQTWLNISSSTCPLCRLSYNEKSPPLSIHSILAQISIRCRNSSLGCTEILLYDLLEQHECIDCHFRTKKCRLCEQIILIKDIDQHKNICKPIAIQCNVCQYSIQNEDYIESFTFSNQTILSPISVVNFPGIELFNQARGKNCFYRFYAMFQLIMELRKLKLF